MKRTALIIAALLCMASRHPDRMIRADLALNASFNRGDATDRSWNAKNGTMSNGAVVTAGNRYLTLDGSNDYVDHGDSDNFSFVTAGQDQPFTVSAWVNRQSSQTGSRVLVSKRGYSGGNIFEYGFDIGSAGTGRPRFVLYGNAAGTIYIGRDCPSSISTGSWVHLAAVYSGSEASSGVKIYVNGVQSDNADVSSGTYTGMTNTAAPVRIGSTFPTFDNLHALVDDVRIYNRALTAADVAGVYSSGRE